MQATLSLAAPAALMPSWLELRIDVALPPWGVEADLRRLQQRMRTPGDALWRLPIMDTAPAGFAFRYREADGEQYLYVEDLATGRLAGYTVFNRLVELGRRADLHLRAPHSKYSRHYQRRGIGTAVYRWALERGMCLMTGARQSTGAHALWRALSSQYELGHVSLDSRKLSYLGPRVAPAVLEDFSTRMVLLGRGWTLERFAAETGMVMPGEGCCPAAAVPAAGTRESACAARAARLHGTRC